MNKKNTVELGSEAEVLGFNTHGIANNKFVITDVEPQKKTIIKRILSFFGLNKKKKY